MELKADNIGVDLQAERLARTGDVRRRVMEIRGAGADDVSLDKPAVARSTPLVIPLITQLAVSLAYSLLFVGLVAFIATELT